MSFFKGRKHFLLLPAFFSFPTMFSKSIVSWVIKSGLFGKGLTSPGFYMSAVSLLKTLWVKEKLLVTSNFSFSSSVFYSFGKLSAIFIKFEIVVCKLFQFGRVTNLSFGKGLIYLQEVLTHVSLCGLPRLTWANTLYFL